jgi:hypothetical protein
MRPPIFLIIMAASAAVVFVICIRNPPGHILLLKSVACVGMGFVFYFSFKRLLKK